MENELFRKSDEFIQYREIIKINTTALVKLGKKADKYDRLLAYIDHESGLNPVKNEAIAKLLLFITELEKETSK